MIMKKISRPHFQNILERLKCKSARKPICYLNPNFSQMNLLGSKHGWIRVVEAFIAIMMIFAALLIMISRQSQQGDYTEEIIKLQSSIISQISQDDILRSEILSNNTDGTEKYIAGAIPKNINFSVNICPYLDVCPNMVNYSYILDRDVYSDETLIAANLTYFNETNAKKLKIFFWEEK